jgi:outer membrane protein OmpA-like peptidoglycan-associated protein
MINSRYAFRLAVLGALWATAAGAQTGSAPAQPAGSEPAESAVRFATTTSNGDTGLWFVPTAEILARGKWSASGYRVGQNYRQGFTNVGDFPLTFGYGVTNRAELFGSFKVVTRIDRDLRPLFSTDPKVGGVVGRYPLVRQGWSGNQVGDLTVGVKFNLMSEADQKPAAVAIRGMLKLPTASKDEGAGTGGTDGIFDFIVSKEARQRVEVSGYAGAIFRGSPDEATQSGGFRYGVGAGFPSRSPLRVTAEFNGETPFDDTTTLSTALVGTDGSLSPLTSELTAINAFTLGLTWQHRNGFFVGGGASWNIPTENRDNYRTDEDQSGDFVDYQFRVGFHPGVRRYVAPPPPPPPAPPPAPPANRPPTVEARCEPCTIEVGRTATVTAVAQDPDGDSLTYRWTTSAGTLQNPADRQTIVTAPQQEGPIQATVTVNDGKGGTASASTTIQVIRPAPVVELTFEDVYFDFDRSTLRPDALRLLDDAIAKLQANPGRNIVIEGHTCNIGTAEYNLALGERRARSVMDYLTSRGVTAGRLETRSFGEERPKYDNAREETRRLNRRAALVVRVQ